MSFADDRRFLQLAKTIKSVEAMAKELGRSLEAVAKTAMRLGVFLKSADARRTKNSVKLGLRAKAK